MGAAAAVAWRLVSTRPPTAETPRTRRRRPGVLAAVSDVRASPLLRWMSAGALLTALLFSLLYLPFSKAAAERYPNADDLAAFFGAFFALSMGTALVLSLLVTSRLLGRFGLPTVVLVMPVLYLVTFGVLAVAATFATLAAFRFTQIAWRSGGAGSTWEALVNTIPAHRRDRVRAFLTGVPTQLGTMVAGAVALIAQRFDEPRVLYGAGLVGSALAVASISRIRDAYPRALVAALREGRPTIFGTPGGPRSAILSADAVGLAVLRDLLTDHEVTARLARGERPRRPRPSRSGRGAGFCGRGRRRGQGSAGRPHVARARGCGTRRRSRGCAAIRYRLIGAPRRSSGPWPAPA